MLAKITEVFAMTARATRKVLFRIHGWIGLNLSILLLLLFATGTILVFFTEIEGVLHKGMRTPAAETQRSATIGEIYDSVQRTYPDVFPAWIERDKASWIGDATVVFTNWGEEVFVWTNPETAEVLGTTSRTNSLKEIVRTFHDSLFTGHRLGLLAVTATSLLLLAFIVTGLVTYRRFWRGFFRAPPRHLGPRAWWAGLHRLAALWSLPFLIVICLTGFYYFINAAGAWPVQYPPTAKATERAHRLPTGFSGADLDRATAVATKRLPGFDITAVVMPDKASKGIKFKGHTDAILADEKASSVEVDPVTFELLGGFDAQDLGLMTRIGSAIEPLHYGLWGGFVSRLLWLIFGALATFVSLFGVMIYAARVLPISADTAVRSSAIRRIWQGMSPLKWLLVLTLAGVAAVGTYRFGIPSERWIGQTHLNPAYDARLWTRGELRAGNEIDLRFQINIKGPQNATVQLGSGPVKNIVLNQAGDVLKSVLALRADESSNVVILTIPDIGEDGTVLTWRLGRPLL